MITSEYLIAIVVWYYPTQQNIQNLTSYIDDVKKIIIIDNSPSDNKLLLSALPERKCIYHPNYNNIGIASALNRGMQIASCLGAKWVLTMDQDSYFDEHNIAQYIHICNQCPIPEVALFSPLQHLDTDPFTVDVEHIYEKRLTVMTSGNLVNLRIYQEVGGFKDEFFIDLVDDEYCCRLHRLGYNIVCVRSISLVHHIGFGRKRAFRFFKKSFIQHNALRHYYIVRNILEVIRLYPEYKYYYSKQLRKRIKRCLLYDSDNKWTKIKNMYLGWYDYHHRIFGPFNH